MRTRLGVVGAAVVIVLLGLPAVARATVSPSGSWEVTTTLPDDVRATHTALLNNGKVLIVSGSGNDRDRFAAGKFTTAIWDPATNSIQRVDTPWDAFCAGHAFLPDGRLLVAGGTSAYPSSATSNSNAGSKEAYVFDPKTARYQKVPDMSVARWYPTLTELGDGRLFTVAGLDEQGGYTNTFQIFDGDTLTWSADTPPPSELASMPMYPALHLTRDGKLFYSGVNTFGSGDPPTPAGIWDTAANTYQTVPGLTDATRRDMGMSVLLPPAQDQRVMVMGGGQQHAAVDAVASTAIIDLKQDNPQFVPGPPMDTAKMYVSAVILPDSTVFETGGASTSVQNGTSPVYSSQIFDPKTNTWRKVASNTVPRLYHSTALLLPDGRVATFGGNPLDDFETRIEVFTPPYLQTGSARPTISGAPTQIGYGSTFGLKTTQAAPIQSAVLVTPQAVTHSSDPNQRLVQLGLVRTPDGVSVTVPNEPDLAPPGWYMLFLVDDNGVPSVASWVQLTQGSYPTGGYLVDGYGGIQRFSTSGGGLPAAPRGGPYWNGWDIARSLALRADRSGGYVVDGYGGLHPFATGSAAPPARAGGAPYWNGWDIVRGVVLHPKGGGYVLDGWGGLHPFRIGNGPMPPPVRGAPYWKGSDVARGVALLPDGSGGYILDSTGALHPFRVGDGPMPPAVPRPYQPGAVPVRGITIQPDGSGGFVSDGWGRLYPFSIGAGTVVTASSGPSWRGWDIGRGPSL